MGVPEPAQRTETISLCGKSLCHCDGRIVGQDLPGSQLEMPGIPRSGRASPPQRTQPELRRLRLS